MSKTDISISILITILGSVLGAIISSYNFPKNITLKKLFICHKLKKILQLKKQETSIVLGIYNTEAFNTNGVKKQFISIPLEIMEAVEEIKKIYELIGYTDIAVFSLYTNDKHMTNTKHNRFVIGGPFSNYDTSCLMLNYFNSIQFPVNSYNKKFLFNNDIVKQFSYKLTADKIDSPVKEIKYGYNLKHSIIYNSNIEDILFLIRIDPKTDFNDSSHGTVHILFGLNSTYTTYSTKLFMKHTNRLHEITKNKKHYFLVFKIYKNNEIDFNNFWDLTKSMFKNENNN
ncbi:MAG: hypothetical protein R3Y35_11255 [Clostridia bacterium]